jgi:hypothetical protein
MLVIIYFLVIKFKANFSKKIIYWYLIIFIDIDECSLSRNKCPPNSTCKNTIGSFSCTEITDQSCALGYQLDEASQECVGNTFIKMKLFYLEKIIIYNEIIFQISMNVVYRSIIAEQRNNFV